MKPSVRISFPFLAAIIAVLLQIAARSEPDSPRLGDSPAPATTDLDQAIHQIESAITPGSPLSNENRRLLASLHLRRGEARFRAAQIRESVTDFDAVIRLFPGAKPSLWQRGISLYYAREFHNGKEQFEIHQTVNKEN